MQAHIDNLMSMIKAQPVAKSGVQLSMKLVALKDDDDIESNLITFERIMAAHTVEKERWPHYLAPQLAGKAQLAFAALSITECPLHRSTTKLDEGEDNTRRDAASEQFLNSFPLEKRLWLVEKKQGSCVAAGELVDEFEQTRRRVAEGNDKSGRVEEDCRRKREDVGGRSSGPSKRRCYQCRQIEHLSKNCPQRRGAMFSREMERCGRQGERKVFRQDMIEGKMVKVFLDTGCSLMMVRRKLVPEHKLIEGIGELQFAVLTETRHSTRWQKSRVKISGRDFKVEAAVADNLPVQLLLGTDVPQLFKLLGSEEPEMANIDDVLVVMTRESTTAARRENPTKGKRDRVGQ
eukprot:Em0003g4a